MLISIGEIGGQQIRKEETLWELLRRVVGLRLLNTIIRISGEIGNIIRHGIFHLDIGIGQNGREAHNEIAGLDIVRYCKVVAVIYAVSASFGHDFTSEEKELEYRLKKLTLLPSQKSLTSASFFLTAAVSNF